jgi:4-phytase/acid phosphatase
MKNFLKISLLGFTALSGLSSTAMAQSENNSILHSLDSRYVLEKSVQLSRHGVRPPTNIAKMKKATNREWDRWTVAQGELTGHGYIASSLLADYQANYYRNIGLLPKGCPKANTIYAISSPRQRTRATAAAILDGMFPGCGEQAVSVLGQQDALFQTAKMGFAPLDLVTAEAEIMSAIGGNLKQAKALLKPELDRLKKAACIEGNICPFYEVEWKLNYKNGGFKITGLSDASSIGESFRLQYSEGLPLSKVAFGHGRTAKEVSALGSLHQAKYDFINDTPHIAKRGGSQLMNQINLALLQGTNLEKNDLLGNPPNVPLFIIVAHDTNLSYLRTMLGFTWQLGEYRKGNIPPTGTLTWQRFLDRKTGKRFIRTFFTAQSMDQIRSLTPLNADNLPLQTEFDLGGCEKTKVGTLCPLKSFAHKMEKIIDRTALKKYTYPQ